MQISIDNAPFQTLIFSVVFWVLVLASVRRPRSQGFFTNERTTEMKGFAILAIVFSHIGYFLSTDTRFLFPLSILAGVGVNLFLFLSGFGLAVSSLKKPLSILQFYFKRLRKLFIAMWVVITIFFLLDYFVLQKIYPTPEIWKSYLGFFPIADLFKNLNSPLWYFTFILFYYLIFPLTFFKKVAYLSPILILLISDYVLKAKLPFEINRDVLNLYRVHIAAFPLGVMFAVLINDENLGHVKGKIKSVLFHDFLKFLWIAIFGYLFTYFSINSGIDLGKEIEQTYSLITMFCIIFLFILKNFEIRFFTIFGIFSYEIYLIHWPILARYDYFYKYLPASAATILYLLLFLGLGFLLQKLIKRIGG